MNRFKAFGIHFLISLAIFIVLVILIFTYWFPGVLADADSSWEQMLLVIAAVDLILGPTLTLIVFNPTKKSLKFDLAAIGILQFTVLAYGVFTVHTTRPLALYLSMPQIGFEVIYADKTSESVKNYLSKNNELAYFYNQTSSSGRYGPGSHKALSPENLSPLNSKHAKEFVEFVKKHGVSFNDKGVSQFRLLTGKTININEQGQILPSS